MAIIGGDFGWTNILTHKTEADCDLGESESRQFEEDWRIVKKIENEITELRLNRAKK